MLHRARQLAGHWQLSLLKHELGQQCKADEGALSKKPHLLQHSCHTGAKFREAYLESTHLILSNSPLKTTMGCPPASATLLCSSWTAMSSFTLKLHSQQDSVSFAAPGSLQASSKAVRPAA